MQSRSIAKLVFIFCVAGLIFTSSHAAAEDPQDFADTWMTLLSKHFGHPENEANWGQTPSNKEKVLLLRFRPNIFIAPGGDKPLNFYKDYIPKTRLKTPTGIKKVTRESLKSYIHRSAKDRAGSTLILHDPISASTQQVGYGRAFYDTLHLESHKVPITILKYNFVFPYSGLPTHLPWHLWWATAMNGGGQRWHILDIHGAIHVILHRNTHRPLAILLAQHNNHRTYLVGKDLLWPTDDRVKISFSKQSNEPYLMPATDDVVTHPTIPFPAKDNMDYLLNESSPPLIYGQDQVYPASQGGERVPYALTFLPTFDPLYMSKVPLGDKFKIFFFADHFSRQAPPGIDFATFPQLVTYQKLIPFWYIEQGDETAISLFKKSFQSAFDIQVDPLISYNSKRLLEGLKEHHSSIFK
ncbi:MAG: hypothetical protein ACI9BD_000152 [Candidatus Marinamargulisbacteria bacterium]|jgi:hypothetical protein